MWNEGKGGPCPAPTLTRYPHNIASSPGRAHAVILLKILLVKEATIKNRCDKERKNAWCCAQTEMVVS